MRFVIASLLFVVCTLVNGQDPDYGSPRRLDVSADEKHLALACSDQKVRVYDLTGGNLLCTVDTELPASCVTFAQDGQTVVCGTEGRESYVSAWELTSAGPKLKWKRPQIGSAESMAVAAELNCVVVTSPYGLLNLYDIATGRLRLSLLEPGNGIRDVSVPRVGDCIVTAGQYLRVWKPVPLPEVETESPTDERSKRHLLSSFACANAVTVSRDGRWAFALSAYNTGTGRTSNLVRLELPDAPSPTILASDVHGGNTLCVSDDGKWIAVGFDGSKVEIRDSNTGDLNHSIDLGNFGHVQSIKFLAKGSRLAISNSHGMKAEVWEVQSGQQLLSLRR